MDSPLEVSDLVIRALSFDSPSAKPHTMSPDPEIRHDWSIGEVRALLDPAAAPLMELVFRAQQVHRRFHDAGEVQVCKLISIKTGGCPEDCSYCSQSARYQT